MMGPAVSSKPYQQSFSWSIWSWLLIGAVTVLWCAHWFRFPLFLDAYYHLHVVQGFHRAGGVTLHDFWQFAPEGRPHLYPPLIHLLMLGLYECGVPLITIGRLMTAASFPLLLGVLWWVCRLWFGRRTAWWTLVAGLMPYTWMLQSSVAFVATFGMLLLLLGFAAIERGRWLAGGVLLGLLWYTHLGIPWIALAALAVYAACVPDRRPAIVRAAALGMCLALPWLVHVLRHAASINPASLAENHLVELYPSLYALAAYGVLLATREGRRLYIGVALLVACMLMLPVFRYRMFDGEGLIAPVMLAGVALSSLYRGMAVRMAKSWRPLLVVALAAALWAVCPTIRPSMTPHVAWRESTPWRVLGWAFLEPKSNDAGLHTPLMEDVVERVRRLTRRHDIVWCNFPFTASLIGALADRPIAGGLFGEVSSTASRDPAASVRNAGLLVWLRDEESHDTELRQRIFSEVRVDRVEVTDLAEFYRNPAATARIRPVEAVLPVEAAWSLCVVLLGVIAWDFRRRAGNRT